MFNKSRWSFLKKVDTHKYQNPSLFSDLISELEENIDFSC